MPHATPTDPLVGTSLADTYEIVRVVAEGGMGRVYEARHSRIRTKRLAIKVIHPELLRNPEIVARFQREVEASAAITDPHVAGVYDVGRTATGQPFLVAEFLEGRDLAEFLETFPKLPVGFAVRLLRQVCRGLSAAHASDVVHRDVKPENIFLSGDMRRPHVKVVDFGISRLDDGQAKNLTQTGVVIGTPAFMPPEQAKGARVDHRADVYAAGAVLYTTVTGSDPFASESSAEALFAVLTREPTPPRELEPSIPAHLEAIIQKSMAKDPDDRFATIDEFSAALAPYDPDESVQLAFPGEETDAGSAASQPAQVAAQEASARMARTSLVALLTLAAVWIVAGLITVGGALVRITSGPHTRLTGAEANLLVLAVLAALLTPSILGVRAVWREVWPNTAKVVTFVARLRAPIMTTVASYGVLSLIVRMTEAVFLQHAGNLSWPGWDLTFVLVSGLVGTATYSLPRLRTRLAPETIARFETLPAGAPAVALLLATAIILVTAVSARGRTHTRATAVRAANPPAADATTPNGGPGRAANESHASTDPADVAPAEALERARVGGAAALATLSDQHRNDPTVFRALALAHASATPPDQIAALTALGRAFQLSPALANDTALRELIHIAKTGAADARDYVGKLLANPDMGSHGPDILFASIQANDGFATQAAQILSDSTVRGRATPALRIALDLHEANTCKEKVALLDRADENGDPRSIKVLESVAKGPRRGCGFLGNRACPPKCRRGAKKMRATMAKIRARGSAP
ncbi:MAG: serine/threonine-protein kinase [Nannocystaceae bacterium]